MHVPIICTERFAERKLCGYALPSEFYQGFQYACWFVKDVIEEDGVFLDYGDDDKITFDKINEAIMIDEPHMDDKPLMCITPPANPKELRDRITDMLIKLDYHERLYRQFRYVLCEEKEVPDSASPQDINNIEAFVKALDDDLAKYGKQFLCVDDYYKFGVLFAKYMIWDYAWTARDLDNDGNVADYVTF